MLRATLREATIIAARNLKKLFRVRVVLFLSFFQSMLWLLLFPQSFGRFGDVAQFRAQGYSSYLMFFAPSALTMTMLSNAFQSGMGMVADMQQGVLDKFLISPIQRSSILLGKVLADAARMILQGTVVLLVAIIMGATIRTGVLGALLMLVVAALFGVAWAGLSNIVALRTKSPETTMMIGVLFTFPLLFLSTAIMPSALLPSWLQQVSRFNPVTYLVDAARSLMNFGYDWGQLGRTLAVIAAVAAVTLTAATRAFQKATT